MYTVSDTVSGSIVKENEQHTGFSVNSGNYKNYIHICIPHAIVYGIDEIHASVITAVMMTIGQFWYHYSQIPGSVRLSHCVGSQLSCLQYVLQG